MGIALTNEEQELIRNGIRRKYSKASVSPEGLFRYPTGRAGLEGLKYEEPVIQTLSDVAVNSYCGVGNPFSIGPLQAGEKVLDIGCGGGVDTMVAAIKVGPAGISVGIDMTQEMVIRARENLQETGVANVAFCLASGEDLPFRTSFFDVVISNGVFNLIPDKTRSLAEVFRVLKPRGRLMMADQIYDGIPPEDPEVRIANWPK